MVVQQKTGGLPPIAWVGIVCGLLIFTFIGLRLAGAVQWYTISTPGCEPSLQRGTYFYASNLLAPKPFDIVTFIPNELKSETWVQRICGWPGDTIEIKNGVLHINGKNVDQDIPTYHDHILTGRPNWYSLGARLNRPNIELDAMRISNDQYRLPLEEEIKNSTVVIEELPNKIIQDYYGKPWNTDQFGPLVIPIDSVFMLGDNRHRSLDSRFQGPVPIKNIIGVQL